MQPPSTTTPESFEHIVTRDEAKQTLAAVVRGQISLPWERVRELIRRGRVAVNDAPVLDPALRLPEGSKVTLGKPARRLDRPTNDLIDSQIVHCDEHLIVVNKPSGISTVPFDEKERGTLVDRVGHWLHHRRGVPTSAPLFVVHRIDKETSGLVVFGRTWLAKRHLAGLFRAHTIERRYLALVHGWMTTERQTMDSVLVENRGDGLRGSARGGKVNGQRAITHVTMRERLVQPATLLECSLETGRTHQIRIHLAEAGHPLLGERVYNRHFNVQIEAPRLMLHAFLLGFSHPSRPEETLRFECEPPEDFATRLTQLRD
ncbi:MAG: RluA family pseudouridine synthase [Deltaproteobacteria bacterium]|nr:RluA family pseudouridine synthase [Deltaproteobacteria bacterium]